MEKEVQSFGALTDRTLAAVRCLLAAGGSLMIYVATEPERYATATYYALALYSSYSFLIYLLARRRISFSWTAWRIILCVDIVCFTALSSLSNTTNNLFSFFYLFAIVVASSRGGTRLGLWVTVVSAFLLIAVGLSVTTRTPYELNRFLLRRLAMVAIGYIVAYWGGAELALKKRLGLLKELSLMANPRFGVEQTINQMLRRILSFYNAEYCIFLLSSDDSVELYRTARNEAGGPSGSIRLKGQEQISLIDISEPFAAIYSERQRPWSSRPIYRGYTPQAPTIANRPVDEGRAIAELLNAQSFVTVTVKYRERSRGRLLVSSKERNAFDIDDAVFLVQAANQALPVLENIRLVDRMASDAAEEERRRIARSVHDRVIQPYFGLQIGLKALHELLERGNTGGIDNIRSGKDRKPVALIEQLMAMTSEGIDELRQYINGLRHSAASEAGLADSIRRFAAKFEDATGVHVDVVNGCGEFAANDRLNAELFQMTAEALSNVHRHTQARKAQVTLDLQDNNLILRVENEVADEVYPAPFNPVSICERAEALGGRTEVFWPMGKTVVRVEVPL